MTNVWVSWNKNVEKSEEITEFFEWKQGDKVEKLSKVAVVKVTKQAFVMIENTLEPINENLLKKVHKQSITNRKNQYIQLDYCVILTDGEKAIVINTESENYPKMKSKLNGTQHESVLKLMETDNIFEFEIKETQIKELQFVGMTREEKEKTMQFKKFIEELELRNNEEEINYWYLEFFNQKAEESKKIKKEKKIKKMESVMSDWKLINQCYEKIKKVVTKKEHV